MEAAYIPEVKDELDTQNFEKFEEVVICLNLYSIVKPEFPCVYSD